MPDRFLRSLALALTLSLPAAAEIVHPEPPPGHEALIRDYIAESKTAVEHVAKRPLGEIRIGQGVRIYSFAPVLREDHEFISRATRGSLLFPVFGGDTLLGLALLAPGEAEASWRASGFLDPAVGKGFLHARETAARLPQVQAGKFEIRYAWIHAGETIIALWLHSEREDLFVPYGQPYPSSLWRPLEVYSEKGIIACADTKAMQLRNVFSYNVGPLHRVLKSYREEAAKTGDTRPATLERLKETLKDELSLPIIASAERNMPQAGIRYHPPGPDATPDDLIVTLQDKGGLAGLTLDGTFKFYREEPAE
jgi:hypothetical protein